jgi:hypothetical protein
VRGARGLGLRTRGRGATRSSARACAGSRAFATGLACARASRPRLRARIAPPRRPVCRSPFDRASHYGKKPRHHARRAQRSRPDLVAPRDEADIATCSTGARRAGRGDPLRRRLGVCGGVGPASARAGAARSRSGSIAAPRAARFEARITVPRRGRARRRLSRATSLILQFSALGWIATRSGGLRRSCRRRLRRVARVVTPSARSRRAGSPARGRARAPTGSGSAPRAHSA